MKSTVQLGSLWGGSIKGMVHKSFGVSMKTMVGHLGSMRVVESP